MTWLNFLEQERLTAKNVDEVLLHVLCNELDKRGIARYSPYKARLDCRALVAGTAIDLGIDLSKRVNGKIPMGRGLLDAWNKVYQDRFGTIKGTSGEKEIVRRELKG